MARRAKIKAELLELELMESEEVKQSGEGKQIIEFVYKQATEIFGNKNVTKLRLENNVYKYKVCLNSVKDSDNPEPEIFQYNTEIRNYLTKLLSIKNAIKVGYKVTW